MVDNNISKFLIEKDMSQKELADKVGLSEVTLSRYVNGVREPRVTTVIRIAKALECKVEDLYNIK